MTRRIQSIATELNPDKDIDRASPREQEKKHLDALIKMVRRILHAHGSAHVHAMGALYLACRLRGPPYTHGLLGTGARAPLART